MPQGFLSIILHAHLPFVRHPEHRHSLEEKWFYEAMLECYLPLLKIMENLKKDGINYCLAISLSPTLMFMMEDELLAGRFGAYLKNMQDLARREEERTFHDSTFFPLARMYREYFDEMADYYYNVCQRRPLKVYRRLQEEGCLEIITTGITHGFLPLLEINRESAYAQIASAVDYYQELFADIPRGMWLPECAYCHSIDEILEEQGIQYFVTDTHGVLYGSPRPKYGVYSPILTHSGVAVFGRDAESSKQVWSSREGYPGDHDYREFYRDIGYDLELDYVGPFLHPPGLRSDTGIKYYRITGDTLACKEPYRPDIAREKAAVHAGNFMFNRQKQVEFLSKMMSRPPIIVAPYDSELFGHWWFEGPLWLDFLCRKIACDQQEIKLITPGQYLDLGFPLQEATPNPSSWGDKGYFEVWLNGSNDWLYPHLHHAAAEMTAIATDYPRAEGIMERAIKQAARELLLAQSSDWPFIMTVDTMVKYARERARKHLSSFLDLAAQIRNNSIDENQLKMLEETDNVFPNINYQHFQNLESTVALEKERFFSPVS
ncbi:MAG: DUF1957 domain-containing protein [Firmicutes bacterium]|jgi:1,4-alpha-glucan branching enzyme|nr:DUF1957 domain-containing protein [Bacillota bacterium]